MTYIPPPSMPRAFPRLRLVKRKTPAGAGLLRKRWVDDDGNIFEWDGFHGRLEKYDSRGRHLGEYCPDTGAQLKPPNPNYRVDS